ncbi:MAG: hypothetical protein LBD59_02840 [Prevotellaceae bacterium]|nr:hypothetical protein [Prevotellaceae bacterium]
MEEKIQLVENKKVCTVWDEDRQEWYFSIRDVVEILTESVDIKQYIKRIPSCYREGEMRMLESDLTVKQSIQKNIKRIKILTAINI